MQNNSDEKSEDELWLVRLNSLLPSLGIVAINFVLARLIRRFASYERPRTITDYNSGIAVRLTIAQVMNTAVVVIIVNYDWEESWFVPGGLAVDMFYIILANAFFSPVLYFLNP
jgi:hypothetical protein